MGNFTLVKTVYLNDETHATAVFAYGEQGYIETQTYVWDGELDTDAVATLLRVITDEYQAKAEAQLVEG